jgi:MFS transporter, DHA2 family, methylenomycin A resistance protein
MGLAARSVPRDRPATPEHAFDGAAAVALTAGVALLVYAVIEGRELGWGSAPIVGALVTAAILGIAFVRRERRHPAPLVDLALLRRRPFLAANVAGAILFGTLTASSVYVSVFLQQVQGHSALDAGLCLLPQGILVAMFGPVAGRLTGRRGPRLPMLGALALCCVSYAALATIAADTPIWVVSALFALLGIVGGLGLPPMTVTAISVAPAEQTGMASAVHAAGRQLGQTLGVAVLGTVIYVVAGHDAGGGSLTGAAADSWLDGLRAAMVLSVAAVLFAAAVIAALVPRGARRVASALQ